MENNMTTTPQQGSQTFQDYIGFLKRRKWYILIPWVLICGIAALVAFKLPAIYRSSATIRIEAQQVPEDLVRTTVTTYAEERIKTITQQILSRSVLEEIIKDFDLYPKLREEALLEDVIAEMKEDITIEMVSASVPNRRLGRDIEVTVAFTVSFENEDRRKVAPVASRLASLYLEYNARLRENLAEKTTAILEKQLEEYRIANQELERKIARFKEEHLTELPELMRLNLETERRIADQLDNLDRRMLTLQERKMYLEGQLLTLSPSPLMRGDQVWEPKDRLHLLRSRAISMEAHLSPKHPDLINIRREIAELEKEVEAKDVTLTIERQIKEKEVQLQGLLNNATEKHPDVVRIKEEIARLKTELAAARARTEKDAAGYLYTPSNPAYINIQTQIKTTELELEGIKKERQALEKKWQKYVDRLEQMPKVEQQYQALVRDYNIGRKKYSETADKLMLAKQAESLERSQSGEKFMIIDPPVQPSKPAKPNRPAIVLIGFILGFGAGVGLAAVREFSDTTIRDIKDVERITGEPVLATVPDISELAGK